MNDEFLTINAIMKRKILLTTFVTLLSSTILFAQLKQVKGRVTDDAGAGLDFASVLLKEKGTGVKCDSLGNFTLKVPDDGKSHDVVFSYNGFTDKKISVPANASTINVKLSKKEAASGDDIVIIGFQAIKRKDAIQTLTTIGAKDLANTPVSSAAEAIAGKAAGVQVTTSEGAPGAATTIKMRGPGSITQDASPLYVVDGIEVENALDKISPQDIQSMDFLKDASATSIYGARGANGVIIITTKSSKGNGKTVINYNGFVGFREVTKTLDVMHPLDYAKFQYEKAFPNSNSATTSSYDPTKYNLGYGGAVDSSDLGTIYKALSYDPSHTVANWNDINTIFHEPNVPFNDWQKIVFGEKPLVQSHNVGISGGNLNTSYNLSYTNNSEGGVMINSGYNRSIVSFKLDHKINDKLKVNFGVRYNDMLITGAGTSNDISTSFNRLRNSIRYKPYGPVDQFDPAYYDLTNTSGLALANPVLLARQSYKKVNTGNLNLNATISYTINKNFSFKSTFGADNTNTLTKIFNDTITPESKRYLAGMPMASMQTANRTTYNWSNVLTISGFKFKNAKHDINGIIGQEIYMDQYNMNIQESDYLPIGILPDKAFANFEQGKISVPIPASYYSKSLASFFGRANYSYDRKYFATFTFRADGSSLFAPADKSQDGSTKQWGYFPSLTFAWKASNEPFMVKFLDKAKITDLKLRATIGVAGNNRIDPYLFTPTYSSGAYYGINNALVSGYVPTAMANNALQWEQTTSRNLGLDVSLFKGKIQLVIDAYKNTTSNLLVNVPKPVSSGYPSQMQNTGTLENTGIDFQLTAAIVQHTNFKWTTNFNIAFNHNEVKNLADNLNATGFQWNSGWGSAYNDYIVKVGESLGAIYGYQLQGDGIYHTYDYTDKSFTQLKTGVPNDAGILGLKTVPQPGMVKLKWQAGDYVGKYGNDSLTSNSRTIIGHAQPKFTGGWGNQFNYKNWDISVFVNFVIGNDILNANSVEFTNALYSQANMLATMNNRWKVIGNDGVLITDSATLEQFNAGNHMYRPATTSNFFVNSKNVEDGSFLRINNLTIGYTFNDKAIKKLFARLRLYATVNNLAVITHYSGYDPEVNTSRKTPMTPGVDYSAYPKSRMYVFGVNVTF